MLCTQHGMLAPGPSSVCRSGTISVIDLLCSVTHCWGKGELATTALQALPTEKYLLSLLADNPEEALHNVLNPTIRSRSLWQPNYWSSAGSESVSANEVLTFRLGHPLCLVREVQIRPFRAHFQLVSVGWLTVLYCGTVCLVRRIYKWQHGHQADQPAQIQRSGELLSWCRDLD